MKLHVLLATLLSVNAAKDIPLITFDGAEPTTHLWRASNDPIMGGKSTGTFEIKHQLGVFDGEVVDVPFLKAPGFIRALARDLKRYPDISSCKALVLSAATKTPSYGGFRFSFGLAHPVNGTEFAYGYKANFKATSPTIADIKMPFDTFSDYWSDATGKAIKTCAEDKRYCPTKLSLLDIGTVAVWAEGVAGKVHLEMKSLRATDCGTGPSPAPPAEKNIVELAESDKDLSTLVTALKAGNLTGALSGKGPFTVFAPSNEGFEKLPAGTLKFLLEPEHKELLQVLLEYHVIHGAVHAADLKPEQKVKTLAGSDILVEKDKHGNVLVNRKAKVTSADNLASNGVVHIIDNVLLPHHRYNIVELAEQDKDLSTLVTALKAGNLTGALSGKGPFTVFAPTNEAFAALPAGELKKLLEPANIKELDAVLEYHVIAGAAVHSKDLKPTQTVKSLEGDTLLIEVMENKYVFINRKSRVLHADLECTNGVVHIVDNVLIPAGNAQ